MGINLLSCVYGLRMELQDSYLYMLTIKSNINNKIQKVNKFVDLKNYLT